MEEQLTLLGDSRRMTQPVTLEVILAQPSFRSAINLCVQISGKEPKEFFMPLGIDKGTWSKIIDGHPLFALHSSKLEQLMDIAGNEIPLIWINYRRGYKPVPLQDAKDKRISDLEAKNAELQKELEIVAKWVKQVRG